MSSNEKKLFPTHFIVGLLMVIAVLAGVFTAMYFRQSPILEGKVYKIAFTQLVDLKIDGKLVRGREFEFADGNDPEKTIRLPIEDKNGLKLIVVNSKLPEGTMRLTMVKTAARGVEGITYPYYEFPMVEFNWGKVGPEPQDFIPVITPQT